MSFVRLWGIGYVNPRRFVDELSSKRAPHCGLGAQFLLTSSLIHVVLRLLYRASDFDRLVNLIGMTALVVGAVLVLWDWMWFAIGGVDQYFLGISHLIIDLWAVLLIVLGMKRVLGVPYPLGIVLNVLGIAVSIAVAMVFMRSPF